MLDTALQVGERASESRERLCSWRLAVAAAWYAALTALYLWPLLRSPASLVTRPGDDALLTSWILWWNGQVPILTAEWWNAPFFYPTAGVMTFSELLLGQLPLAGPMQLAGAGPVLAQNLCVALSFPLSALAAYALVFEITRRHDAAALAGLAFGFGAYRANHIGHIQLLSYYWAPVALLCLHRSRHAARPAWWLAGAGAACLMQVLCNGYALFQLPILVVAWALWFPATVQRRLAVLGALAIGLLPMVPLLLKYREIHAQYGLSRSIVEIALLSADASTFLLTPADNVLLGGALSAGQRTGWFPGLTGAALLAATVVLAIRRRAAVAPLRPRLRRILLGTSILAAIVAASVQLAGPWAFGPLSVSGSYKPLSIAIVAIVAFLLLGPRWRNVWRSKSVVAFYTLGALLYFVLALGPEPRLLGVRFFYQSPYALLMTLPGFESVRAPDRMALLAALCLAVVMGVTYAQWSARLRRRRLVWCALCLGLAIDGWFRVRVQPLPAPGPAVAWDDVEAVVELPLEPASDVSSMVRAMQYDVPIVNGASGYSPPHYFALREALKEGDLSPLQELAPDGALGVIVSRASSQHDALVRRLDDLDGASFEGSSGGWTIYRVPQKARHDLDTDPAAAISRISDARSNSAGGLLTDGRLDTTWLAPGGVLIVELRTISDVSSVRMRPGRETWRFPREVVVETSTDGVTWSSAWEGAVAPEMALGALRDPLGMLTELTFDHRNARFVRVRAVSPGTRVLGMAEVSVH